MNSILNDKIILAADVGATKTIIAVYKVVEGKSVKVSSKFFESKQFDSFYELLEQFEWKTYKPDSCCIAFAGPVIQGKAKATNLTWQIDVEELRLLMAMKNVFLINDLEASAYGLSELKEDAYFTIQKGDPSVQGNAAVISPGTGLGEAGLFWYNKKYYPFATEGGHSDFSPRDELDDELNKWLRIKYNGHVSWERVLSGDGIQNIYTFLTQKMKGLKLFSPKNAAEISNNASNREPIAFKSMNLFFKYLAVESANLTVKLKATGGLYIGGGIVPKNISLLDKEYFLENFTAHGRFSDFLSNVPVHIILNPESSLLGAVHYAITNIEANS